MPTHVEYHVQVLVEMEDGSDVTRFTREYIEGAIPKMFSSARDIRTVITVTDAEESIVGVKFTNNPSDQLREKAWE